MGDVEAFVTKWCAGHDSGTLGPKIRADLESLLASERAAATAACAAHVEEHISRAVGRAWIAEEIRALSPEGWVGVRREDLTELHESLAELHALVVGECPRLLDEDSGGDAGLDIRIRAALARGEGESDG